jgi:hypothetical protein
MHCCATKKCVEVDFLPVTSQFSSHELVLFSLLWFRHTRLASFVAELSKLSTSPHFLFACFAVFCAWKRDRSSSLLSTRFPTSWKVLKQPRQRCTWQSWHHMTPAQCTTPDAQRCNWHFDFGFLSSAGLCFKSVFKRIDKVPSIASDESLNLTAVLGVMSTARLTLGLLRLSLELLTIECDGDGVNFLLRFSFSLSVAKRGSCVLGEIHASAICFRKS